MFHVMIHHIGNGGGTPHDLFGDASYVDAGAAEAGTFDAEDFFGVGRGTFCARYAAGTAADYYEVVVVRHACFTSGTITVEICCNLVVQRLLGFTGGECDMVCSRVEMGSTGISNASRKIRGKRLCLRARYGIILSCIF